ncbi:sugar ABC transporter ATP-binding protein [Streptomyces sp. NPDC002845]
MTPRTPARPTADGGAAPSPGAVLRLRGVTKSFGGAAALKQADLDVKPGEIHALMGMNGAGKSTLVHVLAGVHQADEGRIELDGRTHGSLTMRQARRLGVSFVPQRRELVMGLTVAENILLGDLPLRHGRVSWQAVRAEARTALDDLGIALDVDQPAGALTVAEQTMVEVAREVRRGGRVLILDEPTACLGAEAAQQVKTLVRRLRDEGIAIIYISHYIDEVLEVADRVTVMRDGRIVHTAPTRELDGPVLVRHMVGRDVVSRRPTRPAPKDEIGLQARGLSRGRFIRDFSVEVRKGEVVGVLGAAGDAQSFLFDVLSGRVRPDAGELRVEGRRVPLGRVRHSLRSGLRCVTGDRRNLGVVPALSVDENLMLARDRFARLRLHRESALARRAAPLRGAYGVVTLSRNPAVSTLSGGNQQKVLLAKWLETSPTAVFLEDPTNGVDVAAIADIHSIIDDLASRGVAVLLASSSAEEVMRLADRAVVVRSGRIVAEHAIAAITSDELVATALGGNRS